MNITLPTISPQTMKKYPLYAIIAVLSSLAGYYMNSSTSSNKELVSVYKLSAEKNKRERDSLEHENSEFKEALLIQHGIIQDYRKVVKNTDSLTNKKIGKPVHELIKGK